jgi:predicted Zn-dependent protease
VSSAQVGLAAASLLSLALGVDFGLSNFLQRYLLELPGDRRVELEADAIGLRLMSAACYRPEAALECVCPLWWMVERG